MNSIKDTIPKIHKHQSTATDPNRSLLTSTASCWSYCWGLSSSSWQL